MFSNLNLDNGVLLRVLGIISILVGVAGLSGIWKRWYFRSQKSTVYGYPLLGVLCFVVSYEDQILGNYIQREWVLIVIYLIIMAAVVLISYAPPEFIKPRFVKLIEQESPKVYQAMAKHVMEEKPWRERAKNNDELKKWIKQVKRTVR